MTTKVQPINRTVAVETSRGATRPRPPSAAGVARRPPRPRLKNRIANGVCPCCQRSFPDLYQHMATKHPDYANPEEES